MLQLNVRLMFYVRKHLKMYKNVKKTLEGAPNDSLTNLHKDAQEGAFEVALKGAFEVALGLHLRLHLLMQSLLSKFVKKIFI